MFEESRRGHVVNVCFFFSRFSDQRRNGQLASTRLAALQLPIDRPCTPPPARAPWLLTYRRSPRPTEIMSNSSSSFAFAVAKAAA